jgi:ABC-type transport system substrate-binding protein
MPAVTTRTATPFISTVSTSSQAAVPLPSPPAPLDPTATPLPPTPTPSPIDLITMYINGVPDSLHPWIAREASAQAMLDLVHSGLVGTSSNGQLVPALASSWEPDATGGTVFHLSAGAQWQDGTPVTAADVVASVLSLAGGSPLWEPELAAAWKGASAEALSATAVRLAVPSSTGALLLDLVQTAILPAKGLQPGPPGATPAATITVRTSTVTGTITQSQGAAVQTGPMGAGPYRLLSATAFEAALVRASTTGTSPQRTALRFGDWADSPPATLAAGPVVEDGALPGRLAAGLQRVQAVLNRPVYLWFNLHRVPCSSLAVRRALAATIERQTVLARAADTVVAPLRSVFPAQWWGTLTRPLFADGEVTQAEQALQGGQWKRNDKGAWADVQQNTLHLTLLVDDDPTRVGVAQGIADLWTRFGVDVLVQSAGLDGLLRDFVLPGTFDAVILGIDQRGSVPNTRALWHTGGSLNVGGWSDSAADTAIEASLATDENTRLKGLIALQQRMLDQLPVVPLYVPAAAIGYRGLRVNPPILHTAADIVEIVPDILPQ